MGWLSTLRLAAFALSAVLITILANERLGTLVLIAVPLFVFGFGLLIKRHNRVAYLKRHTTHLREVNEDELLKLGNQLSGFPTGQAFVNRDHPYVSDLDFFGPHSLFQLLNRTTTESGSLCLAEWLSDSASKDVILERQQAIKELAPNVDWRQHFQALGRHHQNSKSAYLDLLSWVKKPEQLLPHKSKYLAVSILLSLLSTSASVFFLAYIFSPDWLMGMIPLTIVLLVNLLVLRRITPIADEIIEDTRNNQKTLAGYQSLIAEIELGSFHSGKLQKLQQVFRVNGFSAANEINQLKKIFEMGDARRNSFYSIFNILWFLDVYWIILTEKWKSKNRPYLEDWAFAVSEFEVLNSIAAFYYSNPSFTFAEINKEPYSILFEMVGHPLISTEHRVCNDFDLEGRGKIAMITGSNMAGKSTFLRTIGVNLVLALMGAPCCAKSGQVSNMRLFTSMRTLDNLEEGSSSFHAELKRIEQLLKLINSGQAIFFLLDEMFKGTNSQDRHKGGVSLIKQLSELNAFGIISTHDLELAKLASTLKIGANFNFYSEILEGEMTFNYKLTKGICSDFNASELMKKSGINILSNLE